MDCERRPNWTPIDRDRNVPFFLTLEIGNYGHAGLHIIIKEDVLMRVTNIRKKSQKGYGTEPEAIHIYRGLLIKLQAAQKNNKTCCK